MNNRLAYPLIAALAVALELSSGPGAGVPGDAREITKPVSGISQHYRGQIDRTDPIGHCLHSVAACEFKPMS